MQTEKERDLKKKFRIGELAKELKLKKFVIRFWEKEFGLHSDRSRGGQRFYTEEDLSTFSTIKELLYEQGFTIAGARHQLKAIKEQPAALELLKVGGNVAPATTIHDDFGQQREQTSQPQPTPSVSNEMLSFLKTIRDKLAELKNMLTR